jgi:eukaryotic translation initiation factor 2C
MFPKLLRQFVKVNGCPPTHVYYLRDGIDEGQFERVLEVEVDHIAKLFTEEGYPKPKFTVIIATKRHHIRFFPKPNDMSTGDKNGNPLPGTLVERDATHPHHFDFYLCSHVAIQGTARPVHYQVIKDDNNTQPNLLQRMIYWQCYQYIRSTTPVSLHPAVYYSHIAALRARAHENIASSQKEYPGGKEGHPIGKNLGKTVGASSVTSSSKLGLKAPLLLALKGPGIPDGMAAFFDMTMWYI